VSAVGEALVRGLLAFVFVAAASATAVAADLQRHPAWRLYPAFAVGYAVVEFSL
jgi:hypothetical protein